MNKKGFLFVVTIFLILTYILLSISVWVKSIETSEREYSEFYKESTVQLAISQITPERVDLVSNNILNRDLYDLNSESVSNPLLQGPPDNQSQYVSLALYSLLMNGTAPRYYFESGRVMPSDMQSSLQSWVHSLNTSLSAVGVTVSEFQVSGFNLSQETPDTLNYSFDMKLRITDAANTSSTARSYHISNSLNVTGLIDPAIVRESSRGGRPAIYRPFFFNLNIYNQSGNIRVIKDNSVTSSGGQGWFYGYMASTDVHPSNGMESYTDVPLNETSQYILVGTYSAILANPEYALFGAYVVTDAPLHTLACSSGGSSSFSESNTFNPITYSSSACTAAINSADLSYTQKPFIVLPRFSASASDYNCPKLYTNSVATTKCALFVNEYSWHDVLGTPLDKLSNISVASSNVGIYSVEHLRDFVMCGYYTQNPAAPSYIQRLMYNSYNLRDARFGIETFVIGEYANSTSYMGRSRLDRELFSPSGSVSGFNIRGLPGCKNSLDCSASLSIGVFGASPAVISEYGLGSIACNGAGCN